MIDLSPTELYLHFPTYDRSLTPVLHIPDTQLLYVLLFFFFFAFPNCSEPRIWPKCAVCVPFLSAAPIFFLTYRLRCKSAAESTWCSYTKLADPLYQLHYIKRSNATWINTMVCPQNWHATQINIWLKSKQMLSN